MWHYARFFWKTFRSLIVFNEPPVLKSSPCHHGLSYYFYLVDKSSFLVSKFYLIEEEIVCFFVHSRHLVYRKKKKASIIQLGCWTYENCEQMTTICEQMNCLNTDFYQSIPTEICNAQFPMATSSIYTQMSCLWYLYTLLNCIILLWAKQLQLDGLKNTSCYLLCSPWPAFSNKHLQT